MIIQYVMAERKIDYKRALTFDNHEELGQVLFVDDRGFHARLKPHKSVWIMVIRSPGCRVTNDMIREELNTNPVTAPYAWA